jgi:hypothetical protein
MAAALLGGRRPGGLDAGNARKPWRRLGRLDTPAARGHAFLASRRCDRAPRRPGAVALKAQLADRDGLAGLGHLSPRDGWARKACDCCNHSSADILHGVG